MALSEYELQRQLDKTKAAVFRRGDAAFFAPLLCSLKFRWRDDIPTAQTDGEYLDWSPEDFEKCTQEEREATLMHELWHVADMDLLRRGDREPKRWNIACDLRNNRRLIEDGYKIEKSPMFIHDPRITETLKEKIYDKLPKMPPPPPMGGGGSGSGGGSGHQHGPRCQHHLMTPNKGAIIGNVAQAIQSAKASGDPGSVPGSLEELIKQFTAPVVPWEVYLERWMTDLRDYDYTWSKRNRRYPNMYLPSMFMDEGRLDHLRYYIDSSGSITTGDLKCVNGEVKYIWDILKPKKLTIVMFDTVIHQVIELNEGDEFDQIKIVGRGGTDLKQVRDDIIKHNPTAAIIFTDLHVTPMKKLPFDIPILWICSNNKRGTVPFGDIIHVDTRKRK